jgi:hypothetical protein
MSAKLGVKQANLAVTILTALDVTSPRQRYGFARRVEVAS